MNDLHSRDSLHNSPPAFGAREVRLQVKPLRYFIAWLLFVLLSVFVSAGVGMLVGLLAGMVMGAAGIDQEAILRVSQALGFLLGIAISFLCYWWSVQTLILPHASYPPTEPWERPEA